MDVLVERVHCLLKHVELRVLALSYRNTLSASRRTLLHLRKDALLFFSRLINVRIGQLDELQLACNTDTLPSNLLFFYHASVGGWGVFFRLGDEVRVSDIAKFDIHATLINGI